MIEQLAGALLGFAIGVACRRFDVPLPAPSRLLGALLVVAMTLGFVLTDLVLS
jgi:XapX domain-containing protein